VDAAFLLVVGKRHKGLDTRWRDLTQAAHPPGLGFRSANHVSWRNRSCTIELGAWQPEPEAPDAPWRIADDRVVLTIGDVRWHAQAERPPGCCVDDLARTTEHTPLPDVARDLDGVFAVVTVSADGDVDATTDPLGLRCIYYGEDDDVVAISSKAALAAGALAASEGRPVARDRFNPCWLVFTSYWIGCATGFEGVRVLPAGAGLAIDRTGCLSVLDGGSWAPDETTRGLARDELVELVRDDIASTLQATLRLPADRHVIRLTGGKDSRLILAVALWAGLAQRFDYETIGPPALADVRVASELAGRFGLRHEARFVGLAPERSYADRARAFVAATGGMLNIWDLAEPDTPPNEVRIVGLCGEMLRTYRRTAKPVSSVDDVIRLFAPRNFGRLGLLRSDVSRELHDLVLGAVLEHSPRGLEPQDLFDAFYMRHRARMTRSGPLEELVGHRRVMPLYSRTTLRAAFAVGGAARQEELLHYEVMRRCSTELVAHRFAGPGWSPALRETRGPAPTVRSEEAGSAGMLRPPAAKPRSLMQTLQEAAFPERRVLLRSVLQEHGNPTWDLIRRDRVEAALERFGGLSLPERRELYGAITAAQWLGGEQ
jgi:hypothetical protein